jgi:hypothetical protein
LPQPFGIRNDEKVLMSDGSTLFSERLALREIEQGTVHVELWAQALKQANGQADLAKSHYMRLRAAALSKEAPALLLKQIRKGLAEDAKLPADYVSASDLKKLI